MLNEDDGQFKLKFKVFPGRMIGESLELTRWEWQLVTLRVELVEIAASEGERDCLRETV
jgi:hypothetical protein